MSPQKKMKKRKELNALIGLTDSSRKKSKQTSGHRLLRTEPPDSESESSFGEQDEFGISRRSGLFGPSWFRCCSLCLPLCVFLVLAACVLACAGLIWMQISLKEELESLKEKIRIMDAGQTLSSQELLKMSDDLKLKQQVLEEVEGGARGMGRLWSNLSDVQLKLGSLDSALNHLKLTIRSSAELLALPQSLEELQESVASIGSTVTSLQHDLGLLQTQLDQKRSTGVSVNEETRLHDLNYSYSSLNQEIREELQQLNVSQVLHQSWCSEQMIGFHLLLSNLSRRTSTLEQREGVSPSPLDRSQHLAVTPAGSLSRRRRFMSLPQSPPHAGGARVINASRTGDHSPRRPTDLRHRGH